MAYKPNEQDDSLELAHSPAKDLRLVWLTRIDALELLSIRMIE